MNEWKILFVKGLPLEDKYFLELDQDKIDLFNNEFQEEKKDNNEINLEILGKVQNINVEGFDLNKTSSQAKIETMEERVVTSSSSNDLNSKKDQEDSTNPSHPANNDNEINYVINCGNKKKATMDNTAEAHDSNGANGANGNGENGAKEGDGSADGAVPAMDPSESNADFPHSLISKIADSTNTNLIQVDEANCNVLRGIQILDEKEFKNYLKGQKEWEYTFW